MTKRELLKGMGSLPIIATIPVAKLSARSIHCEAELLTEDQIDQYRLYEYDQFGDKYVDTVHDSCWASIGLDSVKDII